MHRLCPVAYSSRALVHLVLEWCFNLKRPQRCDHSGHREVKGSIPAARAQASKKLVDSLAKLGIGADPRLISSPGAQWFPGYLITSGSEAAVIPAAEQTVIPTEQFCNINLQVKEGLLANRLQQATKQADGPVASNHWSKWREVQHRSIQLQQRNKSGCDVSMQLLYARAHIPSQKRKSTL